jgi:PPOX class probable F420-dependent enzyme
MNNPESIGGLAVRWSSVIDEPVSQLLKGQNVAVISTHGSDGAIHARTVWVDCDSTAVLLNSVGGRQWVRDLERNTNVTCTVVNGQNPYEFVSIEGHVSEVTTDGAGVHIDAMSRKYLGQDTYPFHDPANPRLLFRIVPDRILHMAPEADDLG